MATATRKPSSRKASPKKGTTKRQPVDSEARASERAMQESQAAIDRASKAGVILDTLTKAQLERVAKAPAGLAGKALKAFIETGKTPSERGEGKAHANGAKRAQEDAAPFTKQDLATIKDAIVEHDALYEAFLSRAPKGDVRTGLLRVRQSFKQTLKAVPTERTR
jgi:hypothetical protein